MDLRQLENAGERKTRLESTLHITLPHIGEFSFGEDVVRGNIENLIGAIQVPLGIAGPLTVSSSNTQGEFYIPLATTEGALVASVNRGCKAIREAGKATVLSKRVGTTRSLVFETSGIQEGAKLLEWVTKNRKAIKKIAESTSGHLTFLDYTFWQLGGSVYIRFAFDTQDAMGMNMVTIALAKVAQFIEKKKHTKCVSLSANMCVDKKPNFLNFIMGRGFQVWSETVISQKTVAAVLKTSTQDIISVFQKKISYGSMLSGTIGGNAHAANILSAIFLATGQDIAHIAECSSAVSVFEARGEDLYASLYLPDLMVGTVGGGTGLPSQMEALSILGIASGNKGKNAQKLAEIIGACTLAGEISLMASLANNTLALAHQKLGRRGEKI